MKNYIKVIERYWVWILLGVSIATYSVIMLLSLGRSIWFDEGYSILLAREDYGTLLSLTAVDAHPPLYYMLLKLWGSLFGFTEFALRSLSAVLMSGAVVLTAVLTRRLFGVRVALVGIIALMLAPFLLRYGYEIRMYALATCIGVAATYTLVRAWESKKRDYKWWALYAVLVALGMYTLYMTLVVWLAHVAWLAWMSWQKNRRILQWRWVRAYICAVLLFVVPYGLTFFAQMTNSALPGMGNRMTLPMVTEIVSVLAVFTPEWQIGAWTSLLVIVTSIVFVIVLARMIGKLKKETDRNYLALYACLAAVPFVFFTITSLPPINPVFVVRYMAHVSVWVYLFAAVVIALAWRGDVRSRRFASVCAALCVVTLSVGVYNLAQRGNYTFERVQTPAIREIRASVPCDKDTTIVADDPYTYIDAVFYFDGCDMRFYATKNLDFKGGYAPLHDSLRRIGSPADVTTKRLVHLRWSEPAFAPDARYTKVQEFMYDKNQADVYELREDLR